MKTNEKRWMFGCRVRKIMVSLTLNEITARIFKIGSKHAIPLWIDSGFLSISFSFVHLWHRTVYSLPSDEEHAHRQTKAHFSFSTTQETSKNWNNIRNAYWNIKMPSRECVCVWWWNGTLHTVTSPINEYLQNREERLRWRESSRAYTWIYAHICDEEKHQIQRERVYVVSVNVCVRVFHLASHTADHYICSVTAVIVTLYSSFPHLQVRYTHTHAQKMPHAKLWRNHENWMTLSSNRAENAGQMYVSGYFLNIS